MLPFTQVSGAWKVRQLFKLDSHFDSANNVMQSLLSPAIAVLSALLAWHYWQLHHVGYTYFLLAPFAIQAAACLALDIHELSSATNPDARSVARLVALTLLQWLQLRISFVSLVTTLKGRASSRWLLLVKRIEMAIVALPLATFNVIRLLDAPFGKEGGGGGGGMSRPIDYSHVHLASAMICWLVLALSATEQDSYRFSHIPLVPWLRYGELCGAFLFRASETLVRVCNFALFALYVGPGFFVLACALELACMITVGGKLLDVVADPFCIQTLKTVGMETFDLCGTFHPFHKEAEADIVLGQCGWYDAVLKTLLKFVVQVAMLIVSCHAIGTEWMPGWGGVGGGSRQHTHTHTHTHTWLPSQFVLVVMVGLGAQIIFFYVHLKIIDTRKKNLGDVRELARRAAWSFPLFYQMSPGFLKDADAVLVSCAFQPGDHLCRQGEVDQTMHLLVQGLVGFQEPSLLPKKTTMAKAAMKGLVRTASNVGHKLSILARRPSFFAATPASPPGDGSSVKRPAGGGDRSRNESQYARRWL